MVDDDPREVPRQTVLRPLRALQAVLPANVEAEVLGTSPEADLRLRIARTSIRATWIERGWPAEVRRALGRKPRPQLLICPSMSPGGRAAAEDAGVSWLDETGAAAVAVGPLVLARDPVVKRQPTRERSSRWPASLLASCEALLLGTPPTGHAVAAATGLSLGSCLNALHRLQDEQLLGAHAARGPHSGRVLMDSQALLSAYAVAVHQTPPAPSLQVGVLWREPVEGMAVLGERWVQAGVRWAATSALAAAVLAPVQTQVAPLEVFVDAATVPELVRVATTAGLTSMKGGRLKLRPFPGRGTLNLTEHERSIYPTAPWPRVYADLRETGVRGEEAAEHLKEKLMKHG